MNIYIYIVPYKVENFNNSKGIGKANITRRELILRLSYSNHSFRCNFN